MNKAELRITLPHDGTITFQELREFVEQAKYVSLKHRTTFNHENDLVVTIGETSFSVDVLHPEFRGEND